MGANSKRRRADKQRRADNQHRRTNDEPGSPYAGGFVRTPDDPDRHADEHQLAQTLVRNALAWVALDPRRAREQAELLAGPDGSGVPLAATRALGELLTSSATTAVCNGWAPSDLAEMLRRRGNPAHFPLLAALVVAETDRHPADRVAPAWRDDLARLGDPSRVRLKSVTDVTVALGLTALLGGLPRLAPTIPAPGSAAATGRRHASGPAAKQLARVRALLAKAESTQYAEEAETLSAKAQELISRYALERLLQQADHPTTDDGIGPRRFWIDAPYVDAKSQLVQEVASVNRCRAVLSPDMGFITIIGDHGDAESVEVLTTSLLVQASDAMLHRGRQVDRYGTSRTRSFRRSFLYSYALRIGKRLRAATAHASQNTGQAEVLLPALRQQEERVEATLREIFPQVVHRQTSINNRQGWVAGRAAADLARLDGRRHLATEAG